jgi:hypothetical protein
LRADGGALSHAQISGCFKEVQLEVIVSFAIIRFIKSGCPGTKSMMPPSWNAEIKTTVENAVASSEANRQRENRSNVDLLAVPLTNVANELKEYRNQQDASERRKKLFEWLSLAALLATVLLTGLTLSVFKLQLGEMQRVYGPIKASADAANRQLIAATRAWVGPFGASIHGLKNLPMRTNVDYRNSGKEPAINFSFEDGGTDDWGATITSGRPKDLIFNPATECVADSKESCASRIQNWIKECQGKQIEQSEAIFPDSSYSFKKPFVPRDLADISKPDRAVFLQGCFVYRSAVTGPQVHHSAFCYFYRFGMSDAEQMTPCTGSGYAD